MMKTERQRFTDWLKEICESYQNRGMPGYWDEVSNGALLHGAATRKMKVIIRQLIVMVLRGFNCSRDRYCCCLFATWLHVGNAVTGI